MTKSATWPTESCPRNFAIDPSGCYLIAAGEKSDRAASYAINQETGRLEQASTYRSGAGPLWVEVVELG
jgi:6-phosphogluconolactonase